MKTMSDLSENLLGKILSKVPLTSLRSMRSTCKKWDALSKSRVIGKTTREQFLGFMMMDSRVCSLRFNLQSIRNNNNGDDLIDDVSVKQISVLDQIEVSKIFHCHGLMLCVIKDNSRLLVWNPYLGQTRWIQPRNDFHRLDRYALGYDHNHRNHKVLRFIDNHLLVPVPHHHEKVLRFIDDFPVPVPHHHEEVLRFIDDDYLPVLRFQHFFGYEIYDLSSNSWRVLDVTPDWNIEFYHRGVSLKGNTYFFAQEKIMPEAMQGMEDVDTSDLEVFLLCFDFTAERFGPRLSLPFHSQYEDTVALSCVREEQLAVLYQRESMFGMIMEIWVTSEIEPNTVSWSTFLIANMTPLTGFFFHLEAGSFFIDEEEKVAVVFDLDGHKPTEESRYQTAHIIGQDGYFKSVNIREAPSLGKPDRFGYTNPKYCIPLLCSSSYVPSLVHIIN